MSIVLLGAGKVSVAKSLVGRVPALAIGRGDGAWTTPPPVDLTATGLVDPFALLRPLETGYLTPDAGGAIVLQSGSVWSVSPTPTKTAFWRFLADVSEADGEVIREEALYFDPTIDGAVPIGQRFIPWPSVVSPGDLYGVERISPLTKTTLRYESLQSVTF